MTPPEVAPVSKPERPELAGAFRLLSRELLAAAALGESRGIFVKEALEAFSRHAGTRVVALRLDHESGACIYRLEAGPPSRFGAQRGPRLEATSPDKENWRAGLDPTGEITTRLGSYWVAGNDARSLASREGLPLPPHVRGFDASPDAYAVAWIPLAVSRSSHAGLRLERAEVPFDREAVRLYEAAAQILAVALEEQEARWALGERIKELGCLYAIALIAADREANLAATLDRLVATLPPAWQFSAAASARITIDGRRHVSEGFQEGPHRLAADVVVEDVVRGSIEVFYTDEVPRDGGDSPFLPEEERLLETVARETGLLLERFRVDEHRLRLEEQLRHADRLATLGQLAAGVAHEINEPLGSILGFAQLAAKSPALPAGVATDLDKIVRASLHAREVVRKLVLFARREAPRTTPVRLAAVVDDALTLVETRCAKAGIEIVCEDDPSLPQLVADPAQLRQVVVNLAVNAVQAMPRGGRLTVRTRREGEWAVLEVEDDGVGMAPEVLERVFLPFFTTKDVGEGTGLGLALAHGIVASHGGTIRAESGPDRGSRFVVSLPLDSSEVAT